MGQPVVKMIGFDATEGHRTKSGGTFPVTKQQRQTYDIQFPLRDWGWNRDKCKRVIDKAGLPVPVKSACFMCGASKLHELYDLDIRQLTKAVEIEETYINGKHWRTEDHPAGPSTVIGLGRKFRWAPILAERLDNEIATNVPLAQSQRQLELF